MDSVTEENVANIMKERDLAQRELADLMALSLERMWLNELGNLETEYDAYQRKRIQIQTGIANTIKKTVKITKKANAVLAK